MGRVLKGRATARVFLAAPGDERGIERQRVEAARRDADLFAAFVLMILLINRLLYLNILKIKIPF